MLIFTMNGVDSNQKFWYTWLAALLSNSSSKQLSPQRHQGKMSKIPYVWLEKVSMDFYFILLQKSSYQNQFALPDGSSKHSFVTCLPKGTHGRLMVWCLPSLSSDGLHLTGSPSSQFTTEMSDENSLLTRSSLWAEI